MKKLEVTKPGLAVWMLAAVAIPWQLGAKEPVAILVSLIVMALAGFLLLRSPDIEPMRLSRLDLAPLVFLAWGCLSFLWSVNRYQSVMWLAVMSIGVMMYFLARSFGGNAELRRQWLTAYIGVVAAASAWGVLIYLTQNYNRVTSSFYLANPFAAYALPAALLATWYFAKTGRRFMAVCAPIILTAFVLADSRSGFLMLGLAVLAGAMLRLKSQQWLRIVGVVGMAAVLTLSLNAARSRLFHHAASIQGARFSEAAKGESTSVSDRLYYLKSTVAIWLSRPVIGTGAGTFASVHPQYQFRVISAATNAHNFYAQTLAELGAVGGLLAIVIAALIATMAVRAFRFKADRVLALALVIMVIHAALDIQTMYPVVLAAIGALAGFVSSSRGATSNDSKDWSLVVVVVVALGLLVPTTSAYISRLHADEGLASQAAGDYAAAADDYNRAHSGLVYDPDSLTAEGINLYTLAGVEPDKAKAKADLAQAANLAQQAHKLDPHDSQHEFLYARVLWRQLNATEAEKAYQLAIKLDPYNHPEYYADLANLYLTRNKFDQVLSTTTAITSQYSESVVNNRRVEPGLRENLAMVYYLRALAERSGDAGASQVDAAKAVNLDPNNSAAKSLVGGG